MFHQRFGVIVEPLGEMKFSLKNILVYHKRVIVSEGIYSGNHLVDEDAQSPPVDGLAVSLVMEDFGSKILGSSTEGEGPVLYDFGETEICKLEVTVRANQYVFWLEVPVNDVFGV
jgi:hypothetical protein